MLVVQTSDGAAFPISERLLCASELMRSLLDETPDATDTPVRVPWSSGVQESVETLLLKGRVELNPNGKYECPPAAGAQALLDATDFLQLSRDTDGLPELRRTVAVASRREAVLTDPMAPPLTADELRCPLFTYRDDAAWSRVECAADDVMGCDSIDFPLDECPWDNVSWSLARVDAIVDSSRVCWLAAYKCWDDTDSGGGGPVLWGGGTVAYVYFVFELRERPRTRSVAKEETEGDFGNLYWVKQDPCMTSFKNMCRNGNVHGRVVRFFDV